MNNYNFNEIIDRKGFSSLKWDFIGDFFPRKDLIPFWIADMDFKSPQPIIDAMKKQVEHGIFGYTALNNNYYEAVLKWFKKRYFWDIDKDWIVNTPGIIPALNFIVQRFSNPGDKVIVQNPVYYPFFWAIQNNNRIICKNQLKYNRKNHNYSMDFADLRKKVKDPKAKIFVLCSPHNPVGRVWKKDELLELGEICLDENILVVSDEIHCDLIFPPHQHTNFATLKNEFAQNSITCTSASKTFNLPGIQLSNIIIPNQKMREIFKKQVACSGFEQPNFIAGIAVEAAYRHCEPWLDQLILYIEENRNYLHNFIQEKMPEVKLVETQGTYLAWLDFSAWDFNSKELEHFMVNEANVALDEGYIFGEGGEGFERINLACPKSLLIKGLNRIYENRKFK